MDKLVKTSLVVLALIAGGFINIGWAQSGSGSVIEEVLVTATKRETSLQTTPVAVTVVGQATLDSNNVNEFNDIADIIPNFQSIRQGDQTATFLFLRGIGSVNNTELGDPAVSFHIDSIYSPRTQGASVLFYDVERLEVLRGPQGTLFGKNSTGGTVDIITARPKDEFEAYGTFSVGNYDRFGFKGAVNVPLTDGLAVRAAAATEQHDGYVDFNSLGTVQQGPKFANDDLSSVRVSLRYDALDAFNAFVSYERFVDNSTGDPELDPRLITDNDRTATVDRSPFIDMTIDTVRTRFDFRPFGDGGDGIFSGIEASYIFGWQSQRRRQSAFIQAFISDRFNAGDFAQEDRTEGSKFDATQHEFHLRNSDTAQLRWILGVFSFEEENEIRFDIDFFNRNPEQPQAALSFFQPNRTLESIAGFVQSDYDITDRITVTGGLRWSQDEKVDVGGRNFACGTFAGLTPFTFRPENRGISPFDTLDDPTTPAQEGFCQITALNDNDGKWNSLTWLARAQMELSDDIFTYASVSTGFHSGGFGDGPASNFDPEDVTNYEVGAKTTLLDDTLTLNASAFYMDYENLQVSSPDLNPDGTRSLQTTNAAKASIIGFEVEFDWRPTSVDRVSGFFSYLDAEYDEFVADDPNLNGFAGALNPNQNPSANDPDFPDVVDLSGNALIFAPDFQLTVAYEHEFVNDHGSFVPRVKLHYQTESFAKPFNRTFDRIDDYVTIDASVKYEPHGGNWYIEVFGENLTDEAIMSLNNRFSAITNPDGSLATLAATFQPPRTFGGRFHYRFGD